MQARQDAEIKKLWTMVYDTFERRPGNSLHRIFGKRSASNLVQTRLMNSIKSLKKEPPNTTLIASIRADVMLLQTIDYLSGADEEKIQKQIDIISATGEK